jgi:hypothetical protein
MKCNGCANREICVHYATIQSFMLDDKHGLSPSLDYATIVYDRG